MEKKTIVNGIGYLSNLFPSSLKGIDYETMVTVWQNYFEDIPDEIFTKAIKNYRGEMFPNAPRIMNDARALLEIGQPKAEDKWLDVLQAVRRYGIYREQEALDSLDPYTAYITRHIGFRNICMSEDQTWNKKEFVGEYNANKEYEKELVGYLTNTKEETKVLESKEE